MIVNIYKIIKVNNSSQQVFNRKKIHLFIDHTRPYRTIINTNVKVLSVIIFVQFVSFTLRLEPGR